MIRIPRISFIPYVFASLLSGAIAGYVDFHQSEVQPAVLLVAVFSFVLGFVKPKFAWLSALIIGTSIFFVYRIAGVFGFKPAYPIEPGIYASLIALGPAFLSAYMGVFVWIFFFKNGGRREHPRG